MINTQQTGFADKKQKAIFTVLLALVLAINIAYLISTLAVTGTTFGDFKGQRIFCAYTLCGIDPFAIKGIEPPPIAKIGVVFPAFSTSPWGLILGNLFYPAFLPLGAAKVYIVLLNIALLVLVIYSLVVKFSAYPPNFKIILVLLAATSQNFFVQVINFNCGFPVCALVLLAILWQNEHPNLAGIALAFAMTKPQTTLLFCFAMLLQRRFRPLIIAAILDIAAWVGAALLTNTSPFTLLQEFLHSGVGVDGKSFYGIFTMLRPILPSSSLAEPLSMLAGIVFMLFFTLSLRKINCLNPPIFMYFHTAIATTFWYYNGGYDKYTLIIPVLLCLHFLFDAENLPKKQLCFFVGAYCYLERTIVRAFGLALTRTLYHDGRDWRVLGATIYEIGLIIATCILFKFIKEKWFTNAKTDSPRI